MSDNTRTSSSAAKCLRVLFALSGHSLIGVSNSELARGLKESPSTINRCLNTLIAEGAAVKLDTGRFALSVRVLQIATRHTQEFSRHTERMAEINQRILAGANL